MRKKLVTVRVPATSANLGPGFDVIGIALHWFNDITFETETVLPSPTHAVRSLVVDIRGEGQDLLPRDATNLVIKAAYRIFEKAKKWPNALRVTLINRVPLSRGLGSSAAATLGGMAAANALIGKPLSDGEILDAAVKMEGHPDNIVPAFAGGLCASAMIGESVRYFKMPAPAALRAVICSPAKPLPTSQARRVLPSRVPFNAAVFTASRISFLIGAFLNRRYEWLGFAMDDVLHQPARAKLVPGLFEAIKAAKAAGAYGSALSGAGSSVIAFSKAGSIAANAGRAMQKVFASHHIESQVHAVALENQGLRFRY